MEIQFVADYVEFGQEEGPPDFLVLSLAERNGEHYVCFQRVVPFGDGEDEGVYFEVNDQSNSGYECISQCEISNKSMTVRFKKPLGPARIESVKIEFNATDEKRAGATSHLQKIFTGRESNLKVTPS